MLNGYAIIDADCHVMEPENLWVDHIEKKFRDRAPRKESRPDLQWGVYHVDGVPIYRNYPQSLVESFQRLMDREYGQFARDGYSPRAYVSAMDQQGVDQSFLYPTTGLYVANIDGQDPALTAAICRTYNDWIAEFCASAPSRLKPVALLSLNGVDKAIKELRRAVRELHISSVMLRPNPVNGVPLGAASNDGFWSACADEGVTVSFHEGSHANTTVAGADRFSTHFAMHACCHPLEQMLAIVSLLEGAVFEKHPTLRFGFLEAGGGWVPYLLWRLNQEYAYWRSQIPALKRPPSEYFRRQCFVGVEGCEPYLPALIDHIGADKILFATDFPHPDHNFGQEIREMMSNGLSDDDRRRILWDNPRAFYGEEDALAAPALSSTQAGTATASTAA